MFFHVYKVKQIKIQPVRYQCFRILGFRVYEFNKILRTFNFKTFLWFFVLINTNIYFDGEYLPFLIKTTFVTDHPLIIHARTCWVQASH
jgi:hypothetical protein